MPAFKPREVVSILQKFLFILIILVGLVLPEVIFAQVNLDQVNQKVSNRFEENVSRLAAIMEEVRSRKGITETRVAFGGVDTPIKSADYWITYVAEAIAYQRAQKFSSTGELRYSLETLRGKVLRAKSEVGKALNE